MIINCSRFGCFFKVHWVGQKTQAQAEREMVDHLNHDCAGHNPFS